MRTFKWDPAKAITNLKKHQISFADAFDAYSSNQRLIIFDEKHSQIEVRFLLIAKDKTERILLISFTLRGGKHGQEEIRVINVRKASKKEKRLFTIAFKR